jgi:chromosome partitioning protein
MGIPESPDDRTLRMAVLGQWEGDVRELVVTYRPLLHVIPTNIDMFLLDKDLYGATAREHLLAYLLEPLEDAYDVCLLDCAPSLGAGTDAGLVAARRREGRHGGILVPVEAEDSSIRALRLLLRQVVILSRLMRIDLDVLGLIPSRFDVRDGEVVTSTLEAFRGLGRPPVVAEIRKRTDIRQAWRAKVPVLEHAPKSEAAGWYRDLATWLLEAAA